MISNTKVNGSCDGNDEGYEYYDKINTSDQENSSEEGDNVYDVIESQKDKEILNDEGIQHTHATHCKHCPYMDPLIVQ